MQVWKRICLPAQETQEMQVQSLGGEDPLEKRMAAHSSILAGKLHGQGRLVAYRPWSHRVGHSWATAHTHVYQHLKIMLVVLLSWNWIMDCSFLYFLCPCIASVIMTWKNYKSQCHWDSFQLSLPLIFPFCSLVPSRRLETDMDHFYWALPGLWP